MTLKSNAKFKDKLTCEFKYDMRNLGNFLFDGLCFVQSIQGLSYKNIEDLSFMTLNSDVKFEAERGRGNYDLLYYDL